MAIGGISGIGGTARRVQVVVALSAALALQATSFATSAEGVFRIGMLTGQGSGVPGMAAIERAYGMALGRPVEVFAARDFPALIDAQVSGRVDYAIYSATAFVVASQLCGCVEPIVAPTGEDGAVGFKAVLFGRRDSARNTDRTARITVAVPKGVDGSFPILTALLSAAPNADALDVRPAGSASEAEAMFVAGDVDAVVGWSRWSADAERAGGTMERLRAAGMDAGVVEVLWTSDIVSFGPHAVRSDVDAATRRSLGIFLTNLQSQTPDLYDLVERERGGGFRAVTAADYEPLFGAVGPETGIGRE